MRLSVLGMSHKTAPLAERERFAVSADELPALLRELRDLPSVAEVVVLSTCNRVEAWVVPAVRSVQDGVPDVRSDLVSALVAARGLPASLLDREIYWLDGEDAVRHLFRVASSLDSMVVGEPQILGQVKEAASQAREAGTVGPVLGRILDRAFGAAKRVRTETGIAQKTVSIGSVAVDLARRIFDRLGETKVLLVGAGKMAEATARSLASAGAGRVYVANRSYDRAASLAARHGWRARSLEELSDLLVESDVVITSTGSARPILGLDLARKVMRQRKYRPLFLVDIAVPRDVAVEVGELDGVYLYNVDDLEGLSRQNLEERRHDAEKAEDLVSREVAELDQWFRSLQVKPTLVAIRRRAEDVAKDELGRTLDKRLPHLGEEDRKALEKMLEAVVSKLLHPTMSALRDVPDGAEGRLWVEAARKLHGVDANPEEEAP